jgi:hypothetical protein
MPFLQGYVWTALKGIDWFRTSFVFEDIENAPIVRHTEIIDSYHNAFVDAA